MGEEGQGRKVRGCAGGGGGGGVEGGGGAKGCAVE